MKIVAALIALSALSVGCGSYHGMSYTVEVDSSLTPDMVETVLQATTAWETAVPGLTLKVIIANCDGYGDHAHTVCLRADSETPIDQDTGDKVDGRTTWNHSPLAPSDSASADSATITLHPINIYNHPLPNALLNVITHELTHSMTHNSGHIAPGNLMSPMITRSEIPEQITSSDIDYFFSAR
jgi:hypothetical protein